MRKLRIVLAYLQVNFPSELAYVGSLSLHGWGPNFSSMGGGVINFGTYSFRVKKVPFWCTSDLKTEQITQIDIWQKAENNFWMFLSKMLEYAGFQIWNLFIRSLNFSNICEKLTKSAKFHLLLIFHNKFCKRCENFALFVNFSHMCEKFKLQMNRFYIMFASQKFKHALLQ